MVRFSASQLRVYSYADAGKRKDITMLSKQSTRARDNQSETTSREEAVASLPALPSLEPILQQLASATNLNDFFAKEAMLARLFASTIEQMLEAQLTAHLGYQPDAAEGRNS